MDAMDVIPEGARTVSSVHVVTAPLDRNYLVPWNLHFKGVTQAVLSTCASIPWRVDIVDSYGGITLVKQGVQTLDPRIRPPRLGHSYLFVVDGELSSWCGTGLSPEYQTANLRVHIPEDCEGILPILTVGGWREAPSASWPPKVGR